MPLLNYEDAKLYDQYTAQAIELIRLHDSGLSFQGFANTSTDTPSSYTKGYAWICTESGTVFGISASKGQIIRDTGSGYVAESIELYRHSYKIPINAPNPKNFLALKQTKTNDVSTSLANNEGQHLIWGSNKATAIAEYFAGAKTRLYYLFRDGWDGTQYPQYIDYYDYDTGFNSTPVNFANLAYPGDPDNHDSAVICMTRNGYILILTTNREDSELHLYKSDSIESITSFTDKKPNDWTFGGSGYVDYPSLVKCKDKIIGNFRGGDQERRTVVVSNDEGETWTKNLCAVSDSSDHWLYGKLSDIDSSHQGVFQFINFQNNEGSSSPLNYAKLAVIWSDDGINWGNVEYWATNKERGWSKDISGDNNITNTEFINNCMIIDDPYYDSGAGEYPHNALLEGFMGADGRLVVLSQDGTRNADAGTFSVDFRVSIFDPESLLWNHTIVPNSDFQSDLQVSVRFRAFPTGFNADEFDFFVLQNDGTYDQYYRYKYFNGNIEFIEDMTGYSSNAGRMNSTPHYFGSQGCAILTVNDDNTDGNITFHMYDKNMR